MAGMDGKRGTMCGERRRVETSLRIGVHHADAVVRGPVWRDEMGRAFVHHLQDHRALIRRGEELLHSVQRAQHRSRGLIHEPDEVARHRVQRVELPFLVLVRLRVSLLREALEKFIRELGSRENRSKRRRGGVERRQMESKGVEVCRD